MDATIPISRLWSGPSLPYNEEALVRQGWTSHGCFLPCLYPLNMCKGRKGYRNKQEAVICFISSMLPKGPVTLLDNLSVVGMCI